MTTRPSLFSILLLSADPDLQKQIKQELKDSAVTVAKDSGSASRVALKRRFDAVLMETKRGPLSELNELIDMQRAVDPAHTVIWPVLAARSGKPVASCKPCETGTDDLRTARAKILGWKIISNASWENSSRE